MEEIIFRFVGEMPEGKFEFTCSCGEFNSQQIPPDKKEVVFCCSKCKTRFNLWQQTDHWHLKVLPPEEK